MLRELDSMAGDGHQGTQQRARRSQAARGRAATVQYSVMLAERARVALFGNAKELIDLDVLPAGTGANGRAVQPIRLRCSVLAALPVHSISRKKDGRPSREEPETTVSRR